MTDTPLTSVPALGDPAQPGDAMLALRSGVAGMLSVAQIEALVMGDLPGLVEIASGSMINPWGGSTGSVAVSAGQLYIMPVFTGRKGLTLQNIILRINNTGSGSQCQFCLYDSVNGLPTNLIAASAAIAADSAGLHSAALSCALPDIRCWAGVQFTATTSFPQPNVQGAAIPYAMGALQATNLGTTAAGRVYTGQTFGAFPAILSGGSTTSNAVAITLQVQ